MSRPWITPEDLAAQGANVASYTEKEMQDTIDEAEEYMAQWWDPEWDCHATVVALAVSMLEARRA